MTDKRKLVITGSAWIAGRRVPLRVAHPDTGEIFTAPMPCADAAKAEDKT